MKDIFGIYYICYGTGAGDTQIIGTLEDAERAADEGAAYTQISIKIIDRNGVLVAMRVWNGVADQKEDNGRISFGPFGYYERWEDFGEATNGI